MLPYRESRVTRFLLIIFFVLVLGYALFEAQGFLFGPSITTPTGITEVTEQYIRIKGQAARISSLSMNGAPIPVTEDGLFDEPYVLAEGVNRIVLDATDKYGRTRRQVVEIVYTPPPSVGPVATSTAATSTSPVAP